MRSLALLGFALTATAKKSFGGHTKKSYAPVSHVEPAIPEVQKSVTGPTCPEGFAFNGRLCEQILQGDLQTICPAGALIEGQCVTRVAESQECPAGFFPSDGQCIQRLNEPRLPSCAEGYLDVGGRCQMKVAAEVVTRCEIGEPRGNECVVRRYEAPNVSRYCPVGFMEGEHGCFQTEQFDCTPQHVSQPKHVKYGHAKGHGGQGHKTKKVHLKHAKKEYVAAPVQQVQVVQKMCERQIPGEYIVEKSCPVGTIDDGQRCVSESIHLPVQVCTAMGGPNDCYILEYSGYQYSCPEGTVDNGRECVTTIYLPFEKFCPAGSQPFEDACARFTAPQQVCEPGFAQSPQGICVRSEYAQPQYEICTICTGINCVPRDAIHQPIVPRPAPAQYVSYSKKGRGGHGKH